MAVSKRTRFEVFKRDGFKCQYCGRTPPTVVLECDHVHAVANGGTDDETNLVTSCFDCNRGKSDVPLQQQVPSVAERIQREREVAEQVAEFNDFLVERKHAEDDAISDLGRQWFNYFEKRKNKFEFGQSRIPSIRTFLRRLTAVEVSEAMDIAHQRKPCYSANSDEQTFKYFCGVCWKMIREREGSQ